MGGLSDADQLTDRLSFGENGNGAAGEILKLNAVRVDPQMAIHGGEKVLDSDPPVDDFFSAPISSPDDLTGLRASPGNQQGGGVGPVIATGLHCSGRHAGDSLSGAGGIVDFRSATELPRYNDHDPFVESPFEKILDQGDNSPIEPLATILHGIEAMEIDGVIIPITDPTA